MFRWFAALVARFVLFSLGWSPFDRETAERVGQKRVVSVISHTSYWDFVLMSLYRLAHPRACRHLYAVMKPQPFRRFGWLLRKWGFIPATKSEERGKGFVESVVARLKDEREVHLVLSPEGMMRRHPWRSGYFYIARGLDCSVQVLGCDYEKKRIWVAPNAHPTSLGLERAQAELMDEMRQIVPLYPEHSYAPVRAYDPAAVSAVDWVLFSNVATTFFPLYMLWTFDAACFAVGLGSVLVSLAYHAANESTTWLRWLDWLFIYLTIGVYGGTLHARGYPLLTVRFLLALAGTLYCYYEGCGRHRTKARTRAYIVYHSLFHCGVALCVVLPLC